MEFYLVTSKSLPDRIWFRDDEDFRVAMNYVAIVAFTLGVSILAFILMSNHVHFVLQCDRNLAKLFVDRFKRLYGAYYARKYGTPEYLRKASVDIRELKIEDESLHRGIAYVIMNSVAANICAYPGMYRWGTGDTFFNVNPETAVRLDSYSVRSQVRLLRSNARFPGRLEVGHDGFILPRSFVCVEFVESLYRTPNRFRYFLNSSSKARKRLDSDATPSFSDQVIAKAAQDLCRSLFRSGSISELQHDQKSELVRQLHRRFSADISQLTRTTGIPYKELSAMLDEF